VDDATSRLQLLRFVEGESTFDYMQATKQYIERYGKPVAFYSDRHTVFHINKRSAVGGTGMTQYGRALHELGIDIMCANTPAAKGRVERAHGKLQDRLVKEMRLEGISSIGQANAWIDGFVEFYNARFSKPPSVPVDVHRPVMHYENLDDIFTWQEIRTLSVSLTLQHDKVLYLIPRIASAKVLPVGVVASAEMLPAIAPATMASPLPRRGYGHQDDALGAGRTYQRSPATLQCRNRC
jgi:hypothetical protein